MKILETSLRSLRIEECLYADFHLPFWTMVNYVCIKYLCVIIVGFLYNERAMHSSRPRQNSVIQALAYGYHYVPFSSVQSLSHVPLFATPRITAHQASLSIPKLLEFTQTHVH